MRTINSKLNANRKKSVTHEDIEQINKSENMLKELINNENKCDNNQMKHELDRARS